MNLQLYLENALRDEHALSQESQRIEQMRWALRGQIDLLQQLIAMQTEPPAQAETAETSAQASSESSVPARTV